MSNGEGIRDIPAEQVRFHVLLLASLVATITYQAGLDPPGGFWPDNNRGGRRVGDSILWTERPIRYHVFFYCNSIAFLVSLVAILMVQNVKLVKSHTLLVAMMLDVFALMGAYTSGSCRDIRSSVTVVAMAVVFLVYVLINVLFFTLRAVETRRALEKKHKRLLLVAILVATTTYNVGLNPAGGVWVGMDNDDLGHVAGNSALFLRYPRSFQAFFYCNTVSFLSSIALILLIVNPNLSRLAIRCYALYSCQMAGMLGLLSAYAAGSPQSVRTSIILIVAAVVAIVIVQTYGMMTLIRPAVDDADLARAAEEVGLRNPAETRSQDAYAEHKQLMLLGILGASVTYAASLGPPGGLWPDDDRGGGDQRRKAGNPVLLDTDPRRYLAFFYSNSISFVTSVVIVALLLQQILRKHRTQNQKLLLLATNIAVALDLLGLLAAYAAGTARESRNVVMLPTLAVLVIVVHAAVWFFSEGTCRGSSDDGASANVHDPRIAEQVLVI